MSVLETFCSPKSLLVPDSNDLGGTIRGAASKLAALASAREGSVAEGRLKAFIKRPTSRWGLLLGACGVDGAEVLDEFANKAAFLDAMESFGLFTSLEDGPSIGR